MDWSMGWEKEMSWEVIGSQQQNCGMLGKTDGKAAPLKFKILEKIKLNAPYPSLALSLVQREDS